MRIFAAAKETGAANALAPVLRSLKRRGHRLAVAAENPAGRVFRAKGIPARVSDRAALARRLNQFLPDAVLLGTSWGDAVDKRVLAWADAHRVPSLAVVDMWSHYRERFESRDGTSRFPTRIAVPDRGAQREACRAGLPADRLVVTGQPHLEALARGVGVTAARRWAGGLRRRWRRRFGEGPTLLLFLSEAFADDRRRHGHHRGYTEVDALDGVVAAVEAAERRGSKRFAVLVKPHPEQRGRVLALGPKARARGVAVVPARSALACLLAADVVVGMTSMMLLEGASLGRPVFSFQPKAKRRREFVGTRFGLVPTAFSVNKLARLLSRRPGRGGRCPRWSPASWNGAAERVGRALTALAGS